MENGIYAFYKPKGPSSAKFLNSIKRLFPKGTKIGHAGTLDPLASGILVVAIGRENTKKIHESVEADKEYIAHIKLGFESTTDDEEGEKKLINDSLKPQITDIEKTVKKFVGKISQTPPIYSAIKVEGKRSYKEARAGRELELKARPVEIKEIEVIRYNYPELVIGVVTGKGVYIRALARDIGQELRTGGYLADLERTRVGSFKKEDAKNNGHFLSKSL